MIPSLYRSITARAMSKFSVHPVPCLSDNYAYVVLDNDTKTALAVDPVNPTAVNAALKAHDASLAAILTTHHHSDHSGGNTDMAKSHPNVPILGGDDRIPAMTRKVASGDTAEFGALKIKVDSVPCHTTGHVLYTVTHDKDEASVPPAVFTGDTLFIGGCGRFFEGTADQMHHALNKVLAGMPEDSAIWCGHEYTEANLAFGAKVEPNNPDIAAKAAWAKEQRAKGEPTVPSSIAVSVKMEGEEGQGEVGREGERGCLERGLGVLHMLTAPIRIWIYQQEKQETT